MRALDLFAGARGWDVGARRLGLEPDGVELWDVANRTAAAAGFKTVHEDVTTFRTYSGEYALQTGSPSCRRYSAAGNGAGRRALEHVLTGVDVYRTHGRLGHEEAATLIGDADAALTLEPLRIALEGMPIYLAWEQVPAVLPVWEACAALLRTRGYSVVTGVLNAEQYGVPQTRRRAVLMARRDGRPVRLPVPTHSRYHSRTPERLDAGVKPWVSMAEALGWEGRVEAVSNYGTGGDPKRRGVHTQDQPFSTVTSKTDRVVLRGGPQANGTVRRLDQPAPTVFSQRSNNMRWQCAAGRTGEGRPRPDSVPSPAVTGEGTAHWISDPGHWRDEEALKSSPGARVTPREAAILQTFPADHPFQGNQGEVFTQIGNAVPSLLAEAVLEALLS